MSHLSFDIYTECLSSQSESLSYLHCWQVVDVDRLFTNMETVCEVSAALLHRLHVAMADPDPEAVVIGAAITAPDSFSLLLLSVAVAVKNEGLSFLFVSGEVFIQAKAALEDVYKIYCYHHDDANTSLKAYEKEEQIKQHFSTCILALK